MRIEILTNKDHSLYTNFLLTLEKSMFFYSIPYYNLIKHLLNGTESIYLIAIKNSEIQGIFPLFIKINKKYGNIINSLPFYGSHGSILVNCNLPEQEQEEIKKKLLQKFFEIEIDYNSISSTIITTPGENNLEFYENNLPYNYKDTRIGQITLLPQNIDDIELELMHQFHMKTRNMVRKAMKSNIITYESNEYESFRKLYEIHNNNMISLKGLAKPWQMFDYVYKNFQFDTNYKVFLAKMDGIIIAAILLFYFNKTVEYYTPVVIEEYRSFQPISLLVYNSMIDASKKGYKYYNFGGTSDSQESLYRFKKRWGASDFNYYYYIRLNKNIDYFKSIGKNALLSEYSFFYVLPFDFLNSYLDVIY